MTALGFGFSSGAQAVLADKETIPRLPQLEQVEIHIYRDLRSRIHHRGSYKIQGQDADSAKVRVYSYGKSEMKMVSFSAWTMIHSKKIQVPSSMIETIPATVDNGFSDIVNVEVAFPQAVEGAILHWDFVVEDTVVPIHGFYSLVYRLDADYHLASGFKLRVDSDVDLFTREFDPQQLFKIRKRTKRLYEVGLNRDFSNFVVNETNAWLDPRRFPTVLISTSADWKRVGRDLMKRYESRLAGHRTPLIDSLVQGVRAQTGTMERFRELINLLSRKVRYMGDWRTTFSGQVPRSIEEISSSGFGDCKDLSLIAIRVLRELGYRASFVTIYSDKSPVPDEYYQIPVHYFNHQIVYVQEGQREYWLDPTSSEDPAFIDDSIADRVAVIWDGVPRLKRVPGYNSMMNGLAYHLELAPSDHRNQAMKSQLVVESWGLESKILRGEEEAGSPMESFVKVFFPDAQSITQTWLPGPTGEGAATASVNSKFLGNVSRNAWYRRGAGSGFFDRVFDRTPIGEGFRMASHRLAKAFMDIGSQWVSDLDLSAPATREFQIDIQGRAFVLGEENSCRISSPWARIEFSVENQPTKAHLLYREEVFKQSVRNIEFAKREFKNLRNQIHDCLSGRFLVLEKISDKSDKKDLRIAQNWSHRGSHREPASIELRPHPLLPPPPDVVLASKEKGETALPDFAGDKSMKASPPGLAITLKSSKAGTAVKKKGKQRKPAASVGKGKKSKSKGKSKSKTKSKRSSLKAKA